MTSAWKARNLAIASKNIKADERRRSTKPSAPLTDTQVRVRLAAALAGAVTDNDRSDAALLVEVEDGASDREIIRAVDTVKDRLPSLFKGVTDSHARLLVDAARSKGQPMSLERAKGLILEGTLRREADGREIDVTYTGGSPIGAAVVAARSYMPG